jgi:hypothetical protein
MRKHPTLSDSNDDFALPGSPRTEAKLLARLLDKKTETPQTIRGLIDVSEQEMEELAKWANADPQMLSLIGRSLDYRKKVLEEFEKLTRDGNACRIKSKPRKHTRRAQRVCLVPYRRRQHN